MIRPLGDRVVLEVIDPDEVTKGGVVLPEVALKETNRGVVVAVGEGKPSEMTGRRAPLEVAVGDEVLFSKYAGTEATDTDGRKVMILRADDVIAITAAAA